LIVLHSVSKEVGRGAHRKLVLNNISWHIPRGSRTILLGQRGAGKTTLLRILSGTLFPTSGSVERNGSVCLVRGMWRMAGASLTIRQVAGRLARLYHADANEVVEFVAQFADLHGMLDQPMISFPASIRQQFDFALAYAIPFDFYLFDGAIGGKKAGFSERCRLAFEQRSQEAGVILTTSRPRDAKQFDGSAGIIHKGSIVMFPTVEEALSVFHTLPPPDPAQNLKGSDEDAGDEEDEWV
jgi:capsular polysaccharide transport system ATP-binding protein